MKRFFCMAGLFIAITAAAQGPGTWFALMGDVTDPSTDTVELDLADVMPRGQTKVMKLRVTLAKQRTLPSGEKYASYLSDIAIDCAQNSVVHLQQRRFVDKQWKGDSTFQSFPEVRPMAFGGLDPNPRGRVLRAACR